MQPYPVRYHVDFPTRLTRLELLVRLVAFCVLGIVGVSFGMVFVLGYLALPAFAAIRLNGRASATYLDEDGPRVTRILRWFAAVSAWAALLTDRLPARAPDETVRLEIALQGRPTPVSAMWRLLHGIPVNQRIGPHAFRYLVGLQQWSVRLLAYQASLVDEYPPFSFREATSGSRDGVVPGGPASSASTR